MEKENTEQNTGSNPVKEPVKQVQVSDIVNAQIWKFLNGENFKEMIGAFNTYHRGERKVFISTYLFDIILVAILLAGVSFVGYLKIIDGVSTGTLIGAIIGYALGRFKNQE